MDKITTVLIIVAAILIVLFLLVMTGFNLNLHSSDLNSNDQSNNNYDLLSGSNNASIKILSDKKLNKNSNIVVQLFDNKNQPMSDCRVSCTFYDDTSTYGNSYMATTDRKGIAEFSTGYLNQGTYRISVEYKSYDNDVGGCIIEDTIEII